MFTLYFMEKMRRITILLSMLLLSEVLMAQTSLENYVQSVMEYNLSLDQAALSSESAEWELRRIKRDYLPTIDFNRTADIDFAHRGEGRPWNWATRLEARQIIYNGGAITAQRRKQELELKIELLAEVMAHRAVRLEAERAYWTLSHAEEYLRSMSYYRGIVDTLLRIVGRRYDEGYSAKGDLLQIESRLSDVEYQLSAAKQEYDIALHSYNSLCNNTIDSPVTLQQSILNSSSVPMRCDIEALIDNHPEHRIAAYEAEQGRWQVRTVSSQYMPKIDIRAYGTLQPKQPHSNKGGVELLGGATLNVSSTIFHFGQRRNAVQASKAQQLSLEIEIESVKDAIRLDEQNSWTQIVRTRERVEALRRSLGIASENLEISTFAYNEGQTSILDVMQAQISWLQTYKNYLRAHYDYAMARAQYRYVTGD